eukprot:TRINITY_DN5231_c1_g1_i2.p1 TRINITY_DN5231_c1_g1~~TRINITY_DN5231_c1_g1_i2.p1  ORF type:complete len:405 (-),score=142.27 TRINITY_DN5231_c1_g1_i2:113-1327(-)
MHIREAFLPFNNPSPPTRASKQYLAHLIGEYLRDEMPLKSFFKELSGLTSPISSVPGDIYRWLIHLLIFSDKDPHCKLLGFLLENGVDENDIELGGIKKMPAVSPTQQHHDHDSSDRKLKDNNNNNNNNNNKPRVRKSVSKGLRNPPNKWTKEESQRLIQLVNDYGDKSWKKIAEHVGGGKTGAQCAQHWKRVLCPIIRKGSWDDVEEMKLFQLVEKFGQSWKNIASEIGSRTDIQCRYQYFKSCMSREVPWGDQEDDLLLKKLQEEVKQEEIATMWVEVARYMARARLTKIPRTALECRMRWETITAAGTTTSSSSSFPLHHNINNAPTALPSSFIPSSSSAVQHTTMGLVPPDWNIAAELSDGDDMSDIDDSINQQHSSITLNNHNNKNNNYDDDENTPIPT